ncbi:amino acid permease ScVBA-like protein [Sparassis latifolia]
MLIPEPCGTLPSEERQLPRPLAVYLPSAGSQHSGQETVIDLTKSSCELSLQSTDGSSPHTPCTITSSSTFVFDHPGRQKNISFVRLLFAHVGAALTLFLATTDATIVSTILPTITSQLDATQTQYTWVSVTYMLTQTAFQPLYGKVSDLIGRTTVLYSSMLVFAIGSAFCGAAQSMRWLIIARAVAGAGGGGIVSLVWTITSEIVEVQNQAKWSQALSITWACSAIAGPILGGVFSEKVGALSWRWAFYINLPICAFAFVVLWLSLRRVSLGASHNMSLSLFGRTFDFCGLILFMGGSSCIVIGFNLAPVIGWRAISTLLLIIVGVIVLVGGGFYEIHTRRDALFPPAVFRDPTMGIILVIVFLHNFAFNAGTFYLALFYQAVTRLSPLQAGIFMLTYSLGSALASVPSAWFIEYWQRRRSDTSPQKYIICTGLFISTLGFGILILMNERTSRVLQSVYTLIAGVGLGMLFHAPYQVFTRALRREDTASGTSAFFLVRFTGATVGLTVAGAILQLRMAKALPSGIEASTVLQFIGSIPMSETKLQVVRALTLSIQTIWIVCCPCLGVAFLVCISESRSTHIC